MHTSSKIMVNCNIRFLRQAIIALFTFSYGMFIKIITIRYIIIIIVNRPKEDATNQSKSGYGWQLENDNLSDNIIGDF